MKITKDMLTQVLPDDYNELAQQEALQSVAPIATPDLARAPALSSNNEQPISRAPASTSSMTKESMKISGTIPTQSSNEPKSEDSEARLERLMRELQAERSKQLEDAASRQMKANVMQSIVGNLGGLVGGSQAMNTGAAVTSPQVKGLDIGDLVGQVDKRFAGDQESLLNQYKMLMNAKDKADQRKFQQESLQVQREGNDLKRDIASMKGNNLKSSLTPGQEARDKDWGKRDNEWTTTGRAKVGTNLNKLEEVASKLENLPENERTSDNRLQGRLWDVFQPEDDINMREAVRSAAQETLRSTLGAQFTEKEGEAIMKRAYDPNLSPASNAKRIRTVIEELKQMRDANDAKSAHFGKKGTLNGQTTDNSSENTISNQGPYGETVERNGKTYKWNAAAGKYQLI